MNPQISPRDMQLSMSLASSVWCTAYCVSTLTHMQVSAGVQLYNVTMVDPFLAKTL